MEIWKEIIGYEGIYEVSNFGKVRSLDKLVNHWRGGKRIKKGKILSCINNKGYLRVQLNNFVPKIYMVHRLVCGAFIPNPNNKPQVNHLNGIKSDNRIENLEWCTASDNIKHAYKKELISKKGIKHHMVKLTEKEVREIKYQCKNMSQSKIAEKYNIHRVHVSAIRLNKYWKHI